MALFRKLQYSTVHTQRRDIPEGLWTKCKGCGVVIYRSKIEENLNVCPQCGYHYPLTARQRIAVLTDPESFAEINPGLRSVDVLAFGGDGQYAGKLATAEKRTGMADAVICGRATLEQQPFMLGVMDFRFLGASMGSVAGEQITRLTESATQNRLPLVIVTASGGARMYEGMLSLMQMAKTAGALAVHASAGLPYITILTNPTTAGVSASFASLGDVIIAEPGALVGFAGPRVIKQTTQAELPADFQTSEFLCAHGFIDRVVPRPALAHELGLLLGYFSGALHCEHAS